MNVLMVFLLSFMFQDPKVSSSTRANPDGSVQVTITNQYYLPIVAYAYSLSFVEGKHSVTGEQFNDSSLSTVRAVPPGGQTAFNCGASNAIDIQCVFHAALFADGSIFGDPLWGQRILSHRKYAVWVLDAELQDLSSFLGSSPESTVAVIPLLNVSRDRQLASAGDQDLISEIRIYNAIAVHYLTVHSAVGVAATELQSLIRSLQAAKSRAGG